MALARLQVTVPLADADSQLVFLTVGVIVAFIAQNFLQEYIFKLPGFKFGTFMSFFEFMHGRASPS